MSEVNQGIPNVNSPVEDKLLFLQENMVNFVNQYNLPLVEVSLVLSKYIKILSKSLESEAIKENEKIPDSILSPFPVKDSTQSSNISSFPLETILENVDRDRMDIFDTIIRTVINTTELPFINALTLLRDWESITRSQLSHSIKPGHLFSPIELPEDF
jgi:hypothetical protein